jgi:hypothetical protein
MGVVTMNYTIYMKNCKCPLQLKNWFTRLIVKHPFFHNVSPPIHACTHLNQVDLLKIHMSFKPLTSNQKRSISQLQPFEKPRI